MRGGAEFKTCEEFAHGSNFPAGIGDRWKQIAHHQPFPVTPHASFHHLYILVLKFINIFIHCYNSSTHSEILVT